MVTKLESALQLWPTFLKVAYSKERDDGRLAYVFAYDPIGKRQDVLDLLDDELRVTHARLKILSFKPRTRPDYTAGHIFICRFGSLIIILDQSADFMRMYLLRSSHDTRSRNSKSPSRGSAGIYFVQAIADFRSLKAEPVCWHGHRFQVMDEINAKKDAKEVGLLYLVVLGPSSPAYAGYSSSCDAFWVKIMVETKAQISALSRGSQLSKDS